MRIFIPTRGRERQRTVERLPKNVHGKYRTTLVAPRAEAKGLKLHGVEVLPCPAEGIAATRQWILNKSDDPVVLMLDDDLPIWCVRVGDTNGYRRAEDKDIEHNFSLFAKLMSGFAHGSIGHRLFCHLHPPVYYNNRMLRALAYNIHRMPDGVKFRLPVMEDFDMALQLLTHGKDAAIFNMMVQDQYATNTTGGCSSYRTPELQSKCAEKLQEFWPDYVKLTRRAPQREWCGFGKERVDVRINWGRAAKEGGCTK